MIGYGHSLEQIVDGAIHLKQVHKAGLQFGDLVLITTRNSVYSAYVLDNSLYLVFGGWFDRKGMSPKKTTITGCTWGGSIIKIDILAACGMHLEFGNRVVTTTVRQVCVIRGSSHN